MYSFGRHFTQSKFDYIQGMHFTRFLEIEPMTLPLLYFMSYINICILLNYSLYILLI